MSVFHADDLKLRELFIFDILSFVVACRPAFGILHFFHKGLVLEHYFAKPIQVFSLQSHYCYR